MRDDAEVRQSGEILHRNLPVVDNITAGPQFARHEVLRRPFGATRAGDGNKPLGQFHLRIERRIDGDSNFFPIAITERHDFPTGLPADFKFGRILVT
jgi:hypothetical protein